MCTLIWYLGSIGTFFLNTHLYCLVRCLSMIVSWMPEHDCLDKCCFGCLRCMCFVFLYLHLFIEHVSHQKGALKIRS